MLSILGIVAISGCISYNKQPIITPSNITTPPLGQVKDCSQSNTILEKQVGWSLCTNNIITATSQYCNVTTNYMLKTIVTQKSCSPVSVSDGWIFIKTMSGSDEEVNLNCPTQFSYCIIAGAYSTDYMGSDCSGRLSGTCFDIGNKLLIVNTERQNMLKFYSDRNYIYCVSGQCCANYCDFKNGVSSSFDLYYKGVY